MFKKKSDPKESKALEELIKENFCGKQSVVDCGYKNKSWCEKTCGYYKKTLEKTKYWTR